MGITDELRCQTIRPQRVVRPRPDDLALGEKGDAEVCPRAGADVSWTGTELIVIGGTCGLTPDPWLDIPCSGVPHGSTSLLDGARYNPATNRWSTLPAFPRVKAQKGKVTPVGTTAVWNGGVLYVWVTRQVRSATGTISSEIQALRWRPGSGRWRAGPLPPGHVAAYGAAAVSIGRDIALLDGSICMPAFFSCTVGPTTSALFHPATGTWSLIPSNSVLEGARWFIWTGRALVAVSPDVHTTGGEVPGRYAAAFDPAQNTWTALPDLPVSNAQSSGTIVTGGLWAGSDLVASDFMLVPGPPSAA